MTAGRVQNRLLLFAAAMLFSTGGAAIKVCTLSGSQIAAFRSGIAAIALWLFLPRARSHWKWPSIWIGLGYAGTLVFFVLATKLTTSANAIFLQSTAPLYLLLIGPLVLGEAIRRVDIVVIATVAAGALLLLLGSERAANTAPDPRRGNVLGLCAGVAWAVTLAGLRWLGKKTVAPEAGIQTVIAGNAIAFLTCLPVAIPVHHVTLLDSAVLLYLGVFQIGLAYVALTRSIRHVPALEASTLLLIEPVFNPIWTWLVHGERPSVFALYGGALIIFATFTGTWWRMRRERSQPRPA